MAAEGSAAVVVSHMSDADLDRATRDEAWRQRCEKPAAVTDGSDRAATLARLGLDGVCPSAATLTQEELEALPEAERLGAIIAATAFLTHDDPDCYAEYAARLAHFPSSLPVNAQEVSFSHYGANTTLMVRYDAEGFARLMCELRQADDARWLSEFASGGHEQRVFLYGRPPWPGEARDRLDRRRHEVGTTPDEVVFVIEALSDAEPWWARGDDIWVVDHGRAAGISIRPGKRGAMFWTRTWW